MMISMMARARRRLRIVRGRSGRGRERSVRLTAIFWTWANWTGRLPEPTLQPVLPIEEKEVHAEPQVAS